MVRGPDKVQARAWTIKSVMLRARDGQARLDQAYRRLLSDSLPIPLAADLDTRPPRSKSNVGYDQRR